MEQKGVFTKILAMVGTLLVWFPIAAPIFRTIIQLIGSGEFRFDYLMPAELFPSALAGGGLLLWAAFRARSRRGPIGWSLGLAFALLIGGQVLAVATGMASGATAPSGWPWAVVLGSLAGFVLSLIAAGVGGALLLRDLFAHSSTSTATP